MSSPMPNRLFVAAGLLALTPALDLWTGQPLILFTVPAQLILACGLMRRQGWARLGSVAMSVLELELLSFVALGELLERGPQGLDRVAIVAISVNLIVQSIAVLVLLSRSSKEAVRGAARQRRRLRLGLSLNRQPWECAELLQSRF